MPLLLILFIIVPIAEIALFIQAGELIGLWWTLASVVVTALIGTTLVRKQGLNAWLRAQSAMQENRMPLEEVFTGICLLLSGALLLTPGFLTDAIGLSLLIPQFRMIMGLAFWKRFKERPNFQMHAGNFNQQNPYEQKKPDDIIDGDFEIIDPEENPSPATLKKIQPKKPSSE